MVQNKALMLKAIPTGAPVPGKDLVVENREFDLAAEPPDGGITTQNFYISFDPYQRGRMRDPEIKSYVPAYPLGSVIQNAGIGKIIKSKSDKFQPGDLIYGTLGTEEYSTASEALVSRGGFRKIDNPHNLDLKVFLGALGMPGLTAYASLFEIGQPKSGETIFISAASGAVGQIVGQLAKHEGLKAIGSVGDDKKLDFILNDLGFDSGFNYKKEKPGAALERLAPDGIDIYYENVGGEHLEAALESIKDYGRIVASGMVSQYNLTASERYPIRNLYHVVSKKLTIRGFIILDAPFKEKYVGEHARNLSKWIAEGKIKTLESVTEGIDNAAEGLVGMLEGKNFGKTMLKIADIK